MDRGPISVSLFNGYLLTLPAWSAILGMFDAPAFCLTNCFVLPRTSLKFPLTKDRQFESDIYKSQENFNKIATCYYRDYLRIMKAFNVFKMPEDPIISHYSDVDTKLEFSSLGEVNDAIFINL